MGRNTCFNPKHTASHLECRTSLTPGSGSNRDSIQETGIPFLLRSGECMCQVAKDTRTNLKLSRTQADIRSSWPGQCGPPPGDFCPCFCHLSWAVLTNSALSYPGSSSLPWTQGILTASIPPKGMWSSPKTKTDMRRRGETNTSVGKGH